VEYPNGEKNNMVKFTQRFERHKEVIKAVYLPKKLHLTIFYDESFDEGEVKRIVMKEIDRANLQNSVETLSFYGETKGGRNSSHA